MTARLGTEAEMLTHIEQMTGIRHTPFDPVLDVKPSTVVWKEIRWPTWSLGNPRPWSKVDRNRLAR